MLVRPSWFAVLIAIFLFSGCGKRLSDEQVTSILRDLGTELVRMESGATSEARMEKAQAICTKHGAEMTEFARYLREHPGAGDRLKEYMDNALSDELAELQKKNEARLAEVDKERLEAANAVVSVTSQKKAEIDKEIDQQIETMTAKFEENKKGLLEEIQKLRAQQ